MSDEPHEVKMRIHRWVLEQWVTRDDEGNRLRLTLSEPDNEGFCSATVSVDYADNPFRDREPLR